MAIKFKCPHCQRALSVKDHLAGRRAPCPACKQVLTIPAPIAQPADIEELAAAALADQPEPAAPAEQATVEFTCFYCDEKITVSADLQGKQTPCPECRRIVKVPYLEKKGPKDWRKLDPRVPSGARRDVGPAPEGAWESRSVAAVSREALLEAEAIPQAKERWTWQQWASRGAVLAVLLCVVGLGAWWTWRTMARNRQAQALAEVLGAADKPEHLRPEALSELLRGAGDYTLREGQAEQATGLYQRARSALQGGVGGDRSATDWALQDLAVSQVQLGGGQIEIESGTRIKWDRVEKQLLQTCQMLQTPEGRAEALRSVTRALLARGQDALVKPLAALFPEQVSDLRAVLGLELLATSDPRLKAMALELAEIAQQELPKRPIARPGDTKPQPPPLPANLLVLWLALGQEAKAEAIAPPPVVGKETDPAVLTAYAEGLALLGAPERARMVVGSASSPQDRLRGLVVLADVGLRGGQTGPAREDLQQAIKLALGEAKGKPVSPWVLWKLVRLGVRAGLPAEDLQRVAAINPNPSLRGRSQLELLEQRLDASPATPAENAWVDSVEKDTPAYPLAVRDVVRHNARLVGASVRGTVESWQPETARPFGFLGLALGLQDRNERPGQKE
jgi:hypothetical protein